MPVKSFHFASPPRPTFFGYCRAASVNATLLLALLVAGMALVWLCFQVYQTQQEMQALEQATRNVQNNITDHINSAQKSQAQNKQTDLSKEELKALNNVVKQLNIPWQDIFKQLEKTIPPDIALLSIEPDAQRSQIRLQAEAESLDSLLRYASTLQNYGIFGRLNYSKHETNEQDPNKPARLTFELGLYAPNRLTKPGAMNTQEAFE